MKSQSPSHRLEAYSLTLTQASLHLLSQARSHSRTSFLRPISQSLHSLALTLTSSSENSRSISLEDSKQRRTNLLSPSVQFHTTRTHSRSLSLQGHKTGTHFRSRSFQGHKTHAHVHFKLTKLSFPRDYSHLKKTTYQYFYDTVLRNLQQKRVSYH